jgi:hypothetical protein
MSDSSLVSRNLMPTVESPASAVSWAAIIAGALAASAFSLALLTLGAGIGLVSVSPWSRNNASVATFGILAAAWFIAVQLFAYGLGGYLAGRLRTRWAAVHTDEVFFRDTAHGLLVWALGAIISAMLLSSALSSLASGIGQVSRDAGRAVGAAAGTAAGAATSKAEGPTRYFADMMFRVDQPGAASDMAPAESEVERILVADSLSGDVSDGDKAYISHLVAARTGLSQPDAEKRVSTVLEQAKSAKDKAAESVKHAADAARKTGVYVALWAFVSLLVGALAASYMATVGGRIRDDDAVS